MEHLFCLNTNSFPASSPEVAYDLFENALQGMLRLNSKDDRYTLYLESSSMSLSEFPLAKDFTYNDFIEKIAITNQDLSIFLTELEDKSPALNHVDNEIIEEMASYSFYIPEAATLDNAEVLSLAFFLNASLLSINTSSLWSLSRLKIARVADGRYIDETLLLNNISTIDHGDELFDIYNPLDIKARCGENYVSDDFVEWFAALDKENKYRTAEKMNLASERKFQGGEPLFKSLESADGLREVRFSAYPGGAIRVLFKRLEGSQQAILVGFIKKSDAEGYKVNIVRANEIYALLKSS